MKVTNLTSNITAEAKPTFSHAKLAERVENDLRNFERSYRTKLRDTISGQLAELDKVASVEPAGPPSP